MNTLSETATRWAELRARLDQILLGQEGVKEQVLVCLLAGGHALLEGVPGTGKTILALALAKLVGCRFRRIQFTPDLMPADLLGANIFNQKSGEFEFREGPIFTDLLLADEVNRTPPRTQSALLEAMQEAGVTVDGVRRPISDAFTVLATQNPVEFDGTYPLPEAQRDRFLLKVTIGHPSPEAEGRMLEAYAAGRRLHDESVAALQPVLSLAELLAARRVVRREVRVEPGVRAYMLALVVATRSDGAVQHGAGPRASLALLESCRALALLRGREFVTPDDVKHLAGPVLAHRVVLNPEAEMQGHTLDDVLERVLAGIEVPR